MKMKIRVLIAFVLFSAESLTTLFAAANTQPNADPQAEPEVSLPGIVSTGRDNGGMSAIPHLSAAVLPLPGAAASAMTAR